MDKSTPHYDMAVIKADIKRLGRNAFTTTAKKTAWTLGLNVSDMLEVVCELERKQFYKSVTTYDDHRVWHDVYRTHSHGLEIYIKVTYRPSGGPPVISFKEKNP
ncbi:type II toxin-antitoxin system MqsR family toxin [Pseudomonas viciae]|uniref:Type II toxin-antitoxin system MqsR family toxin n=1 Tax=Pseudomonas viciae TaxID=2505979 RepID=A0A4P7PLV8_9PSED|nr:type II toxin-antitoxin system MqsR family toxin [Pseudomonas viciae]QBZ91675.1 type II toxin-antitoxin system MqsR family toxin [Pseudomonas viciae]